MTKSCDTCAFVTYPNSSICRTCMNYSHWTDHTRNERKEFWKQAALVVAAASNSTDKSTPATWADRMLKDFDERFGE